ncbi:response regulator transcription factor [Actinoalloteichus hymeniacidonis]|uniref:Two component transcriptional regulator, LuxR family n=1 Tax=Actinoalloteichus hymeniacidonis TaxID=340345 RepID=A0AAC9HN64_9PSEU|nr:response regulator transcription factor [Actinoalloteichus hymeniacidonis]AOS62238.1 two component transcriptional regulator, LuxR family [Actinoalloteichus hymeniacidonis]MBB5909736.1 DNA-binding NarL/FixJ family response regulator [Actinoalloteichus hymeniacidonis]
MVESRSDALQPPPQRIRVLVAEDQELARAALRDLIDSDPALSAVGEARNGREAVEAANLLRPKVILMDIRMPIMDGIEATRRICAADASARVIMLTTFDLDEYVYAALRVGAAGFLLKNAPAREIVRAIHTVTEGNAMLAPEVTRRMIAEVAARHDRRSHRSSRFDVLTEREREVVAAIVQGMSNDEIAGALFLSLATVKTYLSRLFAKLMVRDRTQLVILAYESGFVDTLRSTPQADDPRR